VGPRAGLDDLEKREFSTLPGLGTPTPRPSSPYPVVIPTELSRLQPMMNKFLNAEYVLAVKMLARVTYMQTA
jgi:hypothetical protein